jgi:hypothetical protein
LENTFRRTRDEVTKNRKQTRTEGAIHRRTVQSVMHYRLYASHAYCGAGGPASKMASQQEKAFSALRFEVFRSVITEHETRPALLY